MQVPMFWKYCCDELLPGTARLWLESSVSHPLGVSVSDGVVCTRERSYLLRGLSALYAGVHLLEQYHVQVAVIRGPLHARVEGGRSLRTETLLLVREDARLLELPRFGGELLFLVSGRLECPHSPYHPQ